MTLPEAQRAFRPAWPKGCWPNELQTFLLLACLCQQETIAQDAFRGWAERVHLFFIDNGSYPLLPMLYERLRRWNLPYRDMAKLKGIARYFWVRHQTQRRELFALAAAFADAGIEILLLKGAALNATVYEGTTRVMADIDIAVRRRDAAAAMKLLQELGWIPGLRPAQEKVAHGCPFRRGEVQVDLHWDFLHSRPLDDTEQDILWQAADKIEINGITVRTLCAADQVLHICEHGMRMNDTAPFRWLADICLILRRGNVDWQRLGTLAERFELIEPVRRSLSYLGAALHEPVPQAAFEALNARRNPLPRRLEFFVKTRRMPGSHPFWSNLAGNLFDYRRVRRISPSLTLSDYLILLNDFQPPLRANVKRLVHLEAMNTFQTATDVFRRSVAALVGRRNDVRVAAFDKNVWESFSPPEITPHGIIRWSETVAGIRLPLLRHHRTIKLRLAAVRPWRGDLDQCLSFRLNGQVVGAHRIHFNDWNVSLDVVPDMFEDSEFQRLEIRCKPLAVREGDSRALGIPVRDVLLLREAT